jgi:hypothetical protein
MTRWNMPPIAKVYEALSAVADGRVKLTSDTSAEVLSSERDKAYTVKWESDGPGVTSNDNATRWQGYTGYPIIAVLLQTGRIRYDARAAEALKGVPWHRLNEQFKRDYDAAIEEVLQQVEAGGGDAAAIRGEAERIYAALEQFGPERPEPKRSGRKKETRG